MNVRYLLILAIMVLISLSAVSAEENVTCDDLSIDSSDVSLAHEEELDSDILSTDLSDVAAVDDDVMDQDNLTSNPSDIHVVYNSTMWKENLSDIYVYLPEDCEGNFCLMIDDEVIYNQTIIEKSFKIPIKLPQKKFELLPAIWPPIDYKTYDVSAFYNGIDLGLKTPLKVMTYSPDYSYSNFPSEILHKGAHAPMLTFPRSASGIVEFYIDGKLINKTKVNPIIYWENDPFSKLPLGNHTFKVVYQGDDYYHPYNRTHSFLVTDIVIDIPKTINIGHDDCISVSTKPVSGTVKVYIDSKLVKTDKFDEGDYYLSLEPYLTRDSHSVKVVVKTKDSTRSKSQEFNVTYDFDIYETYFIYGEEDTISIDLPDTLKNNLLTVEIDGIKHSFKRDSTINNCILVDISKLSAGNHTLFVSYPGDSRFKALNKTHNFTVDYEIICPEYVMYKDGSKVYLNLPKNAAGSLQVYVNGVLFKTAKLNNGHAEVKIDTLKPGMHTVKAVYAGDDYEVGYTEEDVYASPSSKVTYRFTAGEDKYFILEVPKDCKGYVIFTVDNKEFKVSVKNGIAKYSLKKLMPGEHDLTAEYHDESGYKESSPWNYATVTVYTPKIKLVSCDVSFKDVNIKVKLLNKKGEVMANKKVTIKVAGKTFKVKTDKDGIATLKKAMKSKGKKAKVKVSFMGAKKSKKVKVSPISLKAAKTSKKLKLKVFVNNKVAGKTVNFKVNGKAYSAKINGKHMAKLTVKKPKTSKIKIQAKCLKYSVKQTL